MTELRNLKRLLRSSYVIIAVGLIGVVFFSETARADGPLGLPDPMPIHLCQYDMNADDANYDAYSKDGINVRLTLVGKDIDKDGDTGDPYKLELLGWEPGPFIGSPLTPRFEIRLGGDFRLAKGFIKKIVSCIEFIVVDQIVSTHFEGMRSMTKKFVDGMLVLYIFFLGVRMTLGDTQQLRRELMTKLFWVMLIVFLMEKGTIEYFFNMFKDTQKAAIKVVTGAVDPGVFSDKGRPCNSLPDVWLRLDCTVGYLLGSSLMDDVRDTIATARGSNTPADENPTDKEMAVVPFMVDHEVGKVPGGLPMTMVGTMAFTAFGPIILITVIVLIGMLIAAVTQAVLAYVMALIALVFLALIAPITIPLALFQLTRFMFFYWFRALVAFVISPMLLFGYITFMLHILSFAIHGPPVLGIASAVGVNSLWNNYGLMEVYKRVHGALGAKEAPEGPFGLGDPPIAEWPGVFGKCIIPFGGYGPGPDKGAGPRKIIIQSASPTVGGLPVDPTLDPFLRYTDTLVSGVDVPDLKLYPFCSEKLYAKNFIDEGLNVDEDFVKARIIQLLLATVIILALTVSFMNNVVNFGAQLAGIGNLANVPNMLHVYNSMVGQFAKAAGAK